MAESIRQAGWLAASRTRVCKYESESVKMVARLLRSLRALYGDIVFALVNTVKWGV